MRCRQLFFGHAKCVHFWSIKQKLYPMWVLYPSALPQAQKNIGHNSFIIYFIIAAFDTFRTFCSIKRCNIYRLNPLNFALGIQNVFVVKVSNRSYTHNAFCIPRLCLRHKKHVCCNSYSWYFWRFCSIKRCNIYRLMVIMWPSPKSPVSLQCMCWVFRS